jgi:glyoxylase-like metal-dependent hydrolase (beta-lactamase superfamily II)
VREDDGFTLVDTTLGRGADALIDAARRGGAPIRRIALTHGHGDHVGSVDALRERLGSSAELVVPELDEQILAGKFPGSWPMVRTRADRRLVAGDRIGSLEVVPPRVTRPATSPSSTSATAR